MTRPATPLKSVIGRAAATLRTARGLETVADLLAFHPTRYIDYEADLGELHEGDFVVVIGEVVSARTRPMASRKGSMLTATLSDGRREIDMTFFRAAGHQDKLVPGTRVIAGGQVSSFNQRWQLAHPGYTPLAALGQADLPGLFPLYPSIPKLHNWNLVQAMRVVLDGLDPLPDPVPESVRERRGLVDLHTATRMVHRPQDRDDVARALARLRYDEAFLLQAVLAQRRALRVQDEAAPAIPGGGPLLAAFDARLPFTLTAGQQEVAAQIAGDLAGPALMNRLLQGEVGSGKTVVALRAMLSAVDAGGQAALLAPTEVLAQQHHRSMTAMLGDLAAGGMLGGSEIATRVVLLTGSQSTAQRRQALLEAATGTAGIVVGTHALLQDAVDFAELSLVVVDEQHRFGVEQRDALRTKSATTPHVLVMTATPIPRTIAMTTFGDMETSTLRELPAGRSPIETYVVDEHRPRWLERTWQRIAEECAAGRQAYVVCPRIGPGQEDAQDLPLLPEPQPEPEPEWGAGDGVAPGEGPPLEMIGVLETFAELQAEPALAGLRIGLLHGKLAPADKDSVMREFAAGEIDVLVATTVIEVGVDVPNATVMVVRDADRFGVSQLHQLRGRVGRGQHAGLCLLTTRAAQGPAMARLGGVASTTDGFELAIRDLEQRKEGDILGARQSGRRRLRYLSLLEHEALIADAREDARALIATDPELTEHPVLAQVLTEWLAPQQADFLEKG